MKTYKKGFAGVLLAVVLGIVLLGGGAYFYNKSKVAAPNVAIESTTVKDDGMDQYAVQTPTDYKPSNGVGLSDQIFIKATGDEHGKVMARGDVNGDDFEDAVVQEVHCGASCGVSLNIVLNDHDQSAAVFKPTKGESFEPAYKSSSATKSEVTTVGINDGIISLTGERLACGPFGLYCEDEASHIVRTIKYKFDGKSIIQLSVNPPNPVLTKGQYEFSQNATQNQTEGPFIFFVYSLSVPNGGVGPIALTIDGHLTLTRISAHGVLRLDSGVDVIFDSYGPENMNGFADLKRGDLLFTLVPDEVGEAGVRIFWNKLKPIVELAPESTNSWARLVKASN